VAPVCLIFPPQEDNNCGATNPPASIKEACFKKLRLFCIVLLIKFD